jgi:hypothetical protein
MERFGTKGKRGSTLPRRLLHERLYKLCFDHAHLHFRRGQSAIAQRYFFRALRHSAFHPKGWAYLVLTMLRRLLRR